MGRCRSFRYLLSPTVGQRAELEGLLGWQCELYNAALEERRGAWKWEHRSVSYVDQCRTLTGLREVRPEILTGGVVVCRGTLRRLDWAFAAFYRRCRAGQAPGYPRFRPRSRWDSLQWEDTSGWRLDPAALRLHLLGIGAMKVRLHRPIRGTPKAITVRREGRRWWVTLRCADVPAQPLPPTGRRVGIDLGVTFLVATSDGELVINDRHAQRAAQSLARAQRDLAAKQRGSANRRRGVERVAAAHRRVRNRRADTLHQLSRRLVNDYDVIVHEALPISNLTRRPQPRPDRARGYQPNGAAAKAGLNRCIHDAGWGQLLAMIAYKAESAGRTVIAIDPATPAGRVPAAGTARPGTGAAPSSSARPAVTARTLTPTPRSTFFGPVGPSSPPLRRVETNPLPQRPSRGMLRAKPRTRNAHVLVVVFL